MFKYDTIILLTHSFLSFSPLLSIVSLIYSLHVSKLPPSRSLCLFFSSLRALSRSPLTLCGSEICRVDYRVCNSVCQRQGCHCNWCLYSTAVWAQQHLFHWSRTYMRLVERVNPPEHLLRASGYWFFLSGRISAMCVTEVLRMDSICGMPSTTTVNKWPPFRKKETRKLVYSNALAMQACIEHRK